MEETSMEIAIEAKGLQRRFPKMMSPAVHDLDLTIYHGQLFGLVGPDGAGKTTTLRMLASVLEPDKGVVWVAGHDVVREAETIRELIGYMPQSFSLYPDLSAQENLEFFADIHRMRAEYKQIRIAEMLSFTRLETFRKRRAGNLSGGMKKKLALACALVHAPQILMLDEPSTGVDPVSRRELWTILTEVVQQGVTVILSTPYMDEAERCHQVGMLYGGSLLASGSPEEMSANLPFSIIEVKATPRKEMRRIVGETPGIAEWRPVGDRLRLAVRNENGQVQTMMATLRTRFKEEGLGVDFIRVERPGMEDVFVHLVNERRGRS
jgi:ABC-2 type transport system ATP-binding protein